MIRISVASGSVAAREKGARYSASSDAHISSSILPSTIPSIKSFRFRTLFDPSGLAEASSSSSEGASCRVDGSDLTQVNRASGSCGWDESEASDEKSDFLGAGIVS